MSDVSCRQFEMYDRGAQELGIDPADLLTGSNLTIEQLRRRQGRVPWDQWVVVVNNFERAVGGPDAMRRWGMRIVDHDYMSPLRRVARLLLTPASLYRVAISWTGPVTYPHLRFEVNELDDRRLRVVVTIPAAYRPAPAWLRLVQGTLVVLPRFIALPDAEVQSVIEERRGQYEVRLPAAQPRWGRMRALAQLALRPGSLFDVLDGARRDVDVAYRQARQAEQDLRGILEVLPDPVAVVSEKRIVWVNHRWSTTLASAGATGPQGRELSDFIDAGEWDRVEALFAGAPSAGEPELRLLGTGGRVVLAEASVSRRVTFEGHEAQVLVLRDVTARREAEAAQALGERMASLGTLAAGVAHDLNNPLTTVLGRLDLASHSIDAVSDSFVRRGLSEHVEAAMEGVERAAAIVRDLLIFPRGDDDARRAVSIEDPLDAMARIARNELRHRAQLVRDYHDTPPVLANPARLGQVFLNLILNAAHAIPVGQASQQQIVLTTRALDGGWVAAEIVDTGEGMTEEQLRRAFEPFFTTKAAGQGTGLGLSIAQRIVHEHDGRIEIDSRVGAGTTVRVILPVAAEPGRVSMSKTVTPWEGPRKRLRILAVDDEAAVLRVLETLLEAHQVRCVSSGRAALEQIAADPHWDVVLCDVMMPELTGAAVYEQVKASHPQLARRFVFITGGVFSADTRGFLENLEVPCLFKPFRLEELLRTIEVATA